MTNDAWVVLAWSAALVVTYLVGLAVREMAP
jgi:hypothetical protein